MWSIFQGPDAAQLVAYTLLYSKQACMSGEQGACKLALSDHLCAVSRCSGGYNHQIPLSLMRCRSGVVERDVVEAIQATVTISRVCRADLRRVGVLWSHSCVESVLSRRNHTVRLLRLYRCRTAADPRAEAGN